jgi:four helix bundle protein
MSKGFSLVAGGAVATEAKRRDFRTVKAWKRSHRLVLEVYRLTATFPREEAFGLTSQARRAAASIPANIAEGCGRGGGDLVRFCRIALGSASELDYHLMLAHDLQLLSLEQYDYLARETEEVQRMLRSYIDKVTNGGQ